LSCDYIVVRVLTAGMTILWSVYWQLSCDYIVVRVLTTAMWPHFSLPSPSCTFPTVYSKLKLT